MSHQSLLLSYLLWVIMPVWMLAGVGDWWCHRVDKIELSAGPRESWLHLLMLLQVGIPIVAMLFLDINALILLIGIACAVAHQITAIADSIYADSHRKIGVVEQHIHSFLDVMPLAALSVVILLHWPQFLSIFALSETQADFSVRVKADPLPLRLSLGVVAAAMLFQWLPFTEEWLRGKRARATSAWRP